MIKNKKLVSSSVVPYEKVESIEIQILDLRHVASRMNVQNVLTSYMKTHYGLENQIYIYYHEYDDSEKIDVDIWVEEECSKNFCWQLRKEEEKVFIDVYKFNEDDWQVVDS